MEEGAQEAGREHAQRLRWETTPISCLFFFLRCKAKVDGVEGGQGREEVRGQRKS